MPRLSKPYKPFIVYEDNGYAEGEFVHDFDTVEEQQAKYKELVESLDSYTIVYCMTISKFAVAEVNETFIK